LFDSFFQVKLDDLIKDMNSQEANMFAAKGVMILANLAPPGMPAEHLIVTGATAESTVIHEVNAVIFCGIAFALDVVMTESNSRHPQS